MRTRQSRRSSVRRRGTRSARACPRASSGRGPAAPRRARCARTARAGPRGGAGLGHGRQRTPGRVAAAFALLLGCLAPGLALLDGGTRERRRREGHLHRRRCATRSTRSTRSSASRRASYEMWALTYDYMIGYEHGPTCRHQPGLATEWETSEDGLTWTFDIRDDVKLSDGEPLTADDIAYTYNRILDGGPEAATWGSYLTEVTTVTAPDDDDGGARAEEAERRRCRCCRSRSSPSTSGRTSPRTRSRPTRRSPRTASPSSGPGRSGWSRAQAGGSTYRFEANPDYWGGAPHIDEVVFRVYKSRGPDDPGPDQGRGRLRRGHHRAPGRALEGKHGITAHERRLTRLRRDRVQHRRRSTPRPASRWATGTRRCRTPAFRHALGFAIDRDVIVERVYQGAGDPGSTIIPPAYDDFHWEPPEDEAFTYDPDRAGELLDEAGYTMGDDGFRTMPNGDPIGTLRLFARSDSPTSLDVMNFFKEWLADVGIDVRGRSPSRTSKLTEHHPGGQLRRVRVGLVRRARPELDAQLHDLRPARRLVGLVVLQRGVRRAVRAAADRDRPRGAGRAWSSRCSRCSTRTRRTW